ncbi:hypothetical protein SUDANB176_00335 [Streptomyces sp. enrichment culture]|uniref:hypothetical protein n=1 Tax=Streptomyces sp. enrichment culture TaxID=1795815 RepID=UPI003F57B31D
MAWPVPVSGVRYARPRGGGEDRRGAGDRRHLGRQRAESKFGTWYGDTKARRDKLTAEQLDALRKPGVKRA